MMLYLLLFVMTVMGSVAAFFLKKASGAQGMKEMLLSVNLYIGGGLYFVSALINIYLLRYLPYSVVLPMTSFTYVWTMFLSAAKLGEKISIRKICGVCAIVVGAIMVSI